MLFYDFEVFQEDWMVVVIDVSKKCEHVIVNDPAKLEELYNENKDEIWVGYNSRHYDQYIFKAILCGFKPKKINDHIIVKKKPGWNYSSLLHKVPLNNYDIMSSFHGLKQLEAFMGNDIRESNVPFDIKRKLTPEEIAETIKYCRHDVEQTIEVFIQRKEEFESHISLIKAFELPLTYVSKTKVQLSAIILDAQKRNRDDEFEIKFPDTKRIEKYQEIVNWYKNPLNLDYKKTLKTEVAGVPHVFAWGGLHGAINKYIDEGIFVNVDVASYYPALMIEYGWGSRNMSNPDKYREIRDTRLRLKAERNPMQAPYKIVLNGTYGAMKDKYNNLYDPRQANCVCVGGQLLLLDLIEKLEDHCKLIQSNTDGLFLKINNMSELDKIKEICNEWETRTRMELEFDIFHRIYQKDVNNYIIVAEDGHYEAKGSYVKELDNLDYDLPIVNEAVKNYFINKVHPEVTISNCSELKKFQKIVKVSNKYLYALHGDKILHEKTIRSFASKREEDPGVFKLKEIGRNPEKFALTPERAFIINDDINGQRVPRRLDKQWYIDLAVKRLNDFGVEI